MLVSVGGEVRAECYFRDRRPEDLTNVHSITKSVLSTLVGMAIADGSVGLDTRVLDELRRNRRRLDAHPQRRLHLRAGHGARDDHEQRHAHFAPRHI